MEGTRESAGLVSPRAIVLVGPPLSASAASSGALLRPGHVVSGELMSGPPSVNVPAQFAGALAATMLLVRVAAVPPDCLRPPMAPAVPGKPPVTVGPVGLPPDPTTPPAPLAAAPAAPTALPAIVAWTNVGWLTSPPPPLPPLPAFPPLASPAAPPVDEDAAPSPP